MTVTSHADLAWNRLCLHGELEGYMKKLPSPVISWRSDSPGRVGLGWLHDYTRPEWGRVFMCVNLDWEESFQAAVAMLQIEIHRYELMQKGAKVSDGH